MLAAGLALFCGAALAFRGLLDRFPLDAEGGQSYAALFWFGWFSLAYILFDALPSLFRLDVPLLSEFLGASMLLLGVSVAAFVVATSLLGRDAHVEEEYLALMERRERQEARLGQLRDQASRDALTGLVSRRTGLRTVEDLLEHGRPFAVAYLDMNGLKAVNDTFGHEAGDACLVRLTRRPALVVSRPGGVVPHERRRVPRRAPRRRRARGRAACRGGARGAGRPAGRGRGGCVVLVRHGCIGLRGGVRRRPRRAADRAMYQSKRAYHGRVSGGAR